MDRPTEKQRPNTLRQELEVRLDKIDKLKKECEVIEQTIKLLGANYSLRLGIADTIKTEVDNLANRITVGAGERKKKRKYTKHKIPYTKACLTVLREHGDFMDSDHVIDEVRARYPDLSEDSKIQKALSYLSVKGKIHRPDRGIYKAKYITKAKPKQEEKVVPFWMPMTN